MSGKRESGACSFSIVIPAFNEENYLGNTLDLVKSGMINIPELKGEIIVVDNNSSDKTSEVGNSKGARVVFEPDNQISKARNAGAKLAKGEYLIFLDADTHVSPELLELVLRKLRYDNCGGGGSTLVFDYNCNQIVFGSILPRVWNFISTVLRLAAGSFIFCRKDFFDESGGFSEKLFAGEELFFSRNLKKICKKKGASFEILRDYPVVTSSRKLLWFSPFQILFSIFIPTIFPFALKSKSLCSFWYRRPEHKRSNKVTQTDKKGPT